MEKELDKVDEFIKNFYDKFSDNTTSILDTLSGVSVDNFKIGSEVPKTEEKTDDETYNQFEDLK